MHPVKEYEFDVDELVVGNAYQIKEMNGFNYDIKNGILVRKSPKQLVFASTSLIQGDYETYELEIEPLVIEPKESTIIDELKTLSEFMSITK
jgi:hypothetical protein